MLAKSIRNITQEQAKGDYNKLVNIHPTENDLNKLIGNKIVDYYTFPQRLSTRSGKRKNMNFYDFYQDPSKWITPHALSLYEKHVSNKIEKGKTKEWSSFDFYTNWIHNPTTFKPIIAKHLYEMYNPHTILDISMGWGGRLLGAMSIPNIKYIGFDTNIELIDSYQSIVNDFNVADRVTLIFDDSSKADFSKFKYDMIFTSPPYFIKNSNKGIEVYPHMPFYKSYDEWTQRFFNPVMTNAWNHLEEGGHFCINTNSTDYELLHKLFGDPCNKIDIKNRKRQASSRTSAKGEFIYIWKKLPPK